MHTVLLANQRQLQCFKHYKLVIFTDNTTVLGGLRYRSVRGPAMDPLCKVAPLAALYDSNLPTVDPYTREYPCRPSYYPAVTLASLLTAFPS